MAWFSAFPRSITWIRLNRLEASPNRTRHARKRAKARRKSARAGASSGVVEGGGCWAATILLEARDLLASWPSYVCFYEQYDTYFYVQYDTFHREDGVFFV